jgi:hypothetical protein
MLIICGFAIIAVPKAIKALDPPEVETYNDFPEQAKAEEPVMENEEETV